MSRIHEVKALLKEISARRGLMRDCTALLTMSVLSKENECDSFSAFRSEFDDAMDGMTSTLNIIESGHPDLNVTPQTCEMVLAEPGYDPGTLTEIREYLGTLKDLASDVDSDKAVDHREICDLAAKLPAHREKFAALTQHIEDVLAKWEIKAGADQHATVSVDKALGEMSNLTNAINMIAINAGIEANRAGEHGAGFKVLASEIHRLSDRAGQTLRLAQAAVGD